MKKRKINKLSNFGFLRSPSCGCGQIYDGTFARRIIKGVGVTVFDKIKKLEKEKSSGGKWVKNRKLAETEPL